VSKAVKRDVLFDAHPCYSLVENGSYRRTVDGTISFLAGEEKVPGRTNSLVVLSQKGEQPFAQHHIPIFTALCPSNVNDHARTVNVTSTVERTCFGNPQVGGIGGGDDGPVLDGFNTVQDIEDFLEAQYIGQRLVSPRIVKVLNNLRPLEGVLNKRT
jgi:hypothetical protein